MQLEGQRWAIHNPGPAVQQLVAQAGGSLTTDNEGAVWQATIPFLLADGGETMICMMSSSRWEETQAVLTGTGALKSPVDLDQAVKQVIPETR